MKTETVTEALKAVPPLGVGGLSLCGLELQQWVVVLTLIYTVFLLIDKFPTVIDRLKQFWAWITKE